MYLYVTNIICVCANSLQTCPTLCNPIDYSPSGSSVHGILHIKSYFLFQLLNFESKLNLQVISKYI